jgi:hypothetical protein
MGCFKFLDTKINNILVLNFPTLQTHRRESQSFLGRKTPLQLSYLRKKVGRRGYAYL